MHSPNESNHFCTYFDINYLSRGVTMIESLLREMPGKITVWVLCFDNASFDKLSHQRIPHTRLIRISDFEAKNPEYLAKKSERSTVEYYWTSTPLLPLYVFDQDPTIDSVTYLDADLYFFLDPTPVINEFKKHSILIVPHRYDEFSQHMEQTSGKFNVSWVSFKRDKVGLSCLHDWRSKCLEWCYDRYEDGKFGDQLYLDDWPIRFKNLVVLDHEGANAAPWNIAGVRAEKSNRVIKLNGVDLLFFHFHALRRVGDNLFLKSFYVFNDSIIFTIYLPYLKQLNQTSRKLGLPLTDEKLEVSFGKWVSRVLSGNIIIFSPLWLSKFFWAFSRKFQIDTISVRKGFAAHEEGDFSKAKTHLLKAVRKNPLALRKIGIASRTLESLVGLKILNPFRSIRNGMRRKSSD